MEKNKDLNPCNFSVFSNKKVHWKCKKGHSYSAKVSKRSSNKGCPYCSGNKVSDTNRLSITFPEIAKEWDYSKNGNLAPENISFGSTKIIYWKCHKGHEWQATVNGRSRGRGCPVCNKIELKDGSSFCSLPEACKYLEYKEKNLKFKYNQRYSSVFGNHRYDFYFPEENKYVEITSYNKHALLALPGRYMQYLKTIVKKKKFVENILKAEFEFIQFIPTKEQIKKVRENQK